MKEDQTLRVQHLKAAERITPFLETATAIGFDPHLAVLALGATLQPLDFAHNNPDMPVIDAINSIEGGIPERDMITFRRLAKDLDERGVNATSEALLLDERAVEAEEWLAENECSPDKEKCIKFITNVRDAARVMRNLQHLRDTHGF